MLSVEKKIVAGVAVLFLGVILLLINKQQSIKTLRIERDNYLAKCQVLETSLKNPAIKKEEKKVVSYVNRYINLSDQERDALIKEYEGKTVAMEEMLRIVDNALRENKMTITSEGQLIQQAMVSDAGGAGAQEPKEKILAVTLEVVGINKSVGLSYRLPFKKIDMYAGVRYNFISDYGLGIIWRF